MKYQTNKPCIVCGKSPSDLHHIKSRGAGGDDSLSNLLPLCRLHHIEIHKIGRKTFALKYKIKKILDVIE